MAELEKGKDRWLPLEANPDVSLVFAFSALTLISVLLNPLFPCAGHE